MSFDNSKRKSSGKDDPRPERNSQGGEMDESGGNQQQRRSGQSGGGSFDKGDKQAGGERVSQEMEREPRYSGGSGGERRSYGSGGSGGGGRGGRGSNEKEEPSYFGAGITPTTTVLPSAPNFYAMPEGGDYYEEAEGEGQEEMYLKNCNCDPRDGPCDCKTPPDEEYEVVVEEKSRTSVDQAGEVYQLDEFMRAKSYFLQTSNKSGLNMYDHLSDVIRKFLDDRAPNNPVDYLEEVSMNIKRYRFGLQKADPLHDAFYIGGPILQDAKRVTGYWKALSRWNDEKKEIDGESALFMGGSFQNLLRLQYYLEQVNIGLPREEMFRLALGIKELSATRPQIGRLRLWGKILGTMKNYYVVEAELKFGGSEQAMDLWIPPEEEEEVGVQGEQKRSRQDLEGGENWNPEAVLDASHTFGRAKDVVLNHDILTAYSKTSGLPPEKQADMLPKPTVYYMPGPGGEWEGEDGGPDNMMEFEDPDAKADATKWEGYQQELMDSFPQTTSEESVDIPMEPDGTGINRRVFYVCNNLGEDWILLPAVTPQQINSSRNIRWFLTGNLNSKLRTIPAFPGKEGHYLKALLARITAGGMTTPKGYFKPKPADGEIPGEEDDDELEPEDEELPPPGNDNVQPVKKYRAPMKALTNPNMTFWVHHTAYILPQGRTTWWNPATPKQKRRNTAGTEEESDLEDDDDELQDEDDEEEDGSTLPGKERSPPLFSPISQDFAADGKSPWSMITSSTIFQEFQVVSIRSNVWTGSNVICTTKGKVSNVYIGDGLKFAPTTYCPPIPDKVAKEYRTGPELDETADPSVEAEQSWLDKLALNEIADVEAKFEDNEEEGEGTDEEEEETEYEY